MAVAGRSAHTEDNVDMVELTLNQEGRLHTGYRERWVSRSSSFL